MVQQAQDVAFKELNQRRSALKKLLECEDKIYEEEFANKVKSRIDEDIRQRKDTLLKIKEESANNEREFLKKKRVQQYMNSCYEIRESLRRQEVQNVKECQLEQMLEKERALRRQRQEDEYWKKVQQKNIEFNDLQQRQEDSLKKALVQKLSDTRKIQLEELEEKRELKRQEKLEEKQNLEALLEDMRLDEFNRKNRRELAKVAEYRKALLDMMTEKQEQREKEKQEQTKLHHEMISEISNLEDEKTTGVLEKKKAFRKATLDFIKYVKGMREIDQQQQRMYNERIDDLHRVDMCTKKNIQSEKERKARLAEEYYADLRKQICEQQARRLRDEAEQRESKILENRFVHDDISREQINERRCKYRADLDKQIAEINRKREEDLVKFNRDLKRASNDPELCSELAEQYIRDGIDYLEPHANWRLLSNSFTPDCHKKFGVTETSEVKDKESRIRINCDCPRKSYDGRGDE